jgi:flagellar biosynthetic protein FlhB
MADDSFEEKTEAPTDKRRHESREKGTVAKSTEVNSVIVLLVGILLLKMFGPWLMQGMGGCMAEMFSSISNTNMDVARLTQIAMKSLALILRMILPIAGGILVAGVLANIIQVGFLVTMQPLIPNLNKINPITGMGRLFSANSSIEALKSILKLVIIGTVAYTTIRGEFNSILILANTSVGAILSFTLAAAYKIIIRIVLVLIILAILDYAWQRYSYEKKMKMSKQEVKEEHKQMEGDPKIKSRLRSMQREMARRRMMQQVPKATVVVTNPTYIAIALLYDPAVNDAPVVLAKGKRLIAQRIKQIARENGVPLVEDKPLARAMYDHAEVGFPIPAQFYTAVAEVMAYVYRLRNRRAA